MTIERVYNIPLRKGFVDTAKYKKAKKAVRTLQEFLSRHMRQPDMDKILIGKNLNKELWKHGIKNPPGQVKVVVIKEDNGDVKAELYGFKYEHKKKEQKADAESKEDSKVEAKAKDAKKKSASSDVKKEHHEHDHESHEGHNHEEKHEHSGTQNHEHAKPKAAPKKTVKKA